MMLYVLIHYTDYTYNGYTAYETLDAHRHALLTTARSVIRDVSSMYTASYHISRTTIYYHVLNHNMWIHHIIHTYYLNTCGKLNTMLSNA